MHQPTYNTVRQLQHERQQEAEHQRLLAAARAAGRDGQDGRAVTARWRARPDRQPPLRSQPKSRWSVANRPLRFAPRAR